MYPFDETRENNFSKLTQADRINLDSIKTILPGIVTVFGPNCFAALFSAEESGFFCIAVENGAIDDIQLGTQLSDFASDAVRDESHHGGKNVIGVYYFKTASDHAVKSVISIIRNQNQDVIGCICIGIDVSVPLHSFVRNFIPVVDDDYAVSLADPTPNTIDNVDDLIQYSIEQAIEIANDRKGLSTTERNRLVVQFLNNNSIFNIRGAVNIVAKHLGVSRYTIYNYLKDQSVNPTRL